MMRFQSWSAVAVVIFSILLNADNINNCCSAFSFASTGDPVTAASLSQKAVTKASNNQFMSVGTRRDTIKMPSQTPMVPWTVRFCLFLNTLFRFYCCCFALLCFALHCTRTKFIVSARLNSFFPLNSFHVIYTLYYDVRCDKKLDRI
jgi:hypothetical protein